MRRGSRYLETKIITLIDYIVQRLAAEGITECLGVPGDYAFPVCDAVERNPNTKWIGCSNELNAAYAADGYARARAVSIIDAADILLFEQVHCLNMSGGAQWMAAAATRENRVCGKEFN